MFFLQCILIMPCAIVTTTTPPVTVVCSGATLITMTFMLAQTFFGQDNIESG